MKVQTLFKKALAVLIAVMMLASVTVPSFAADSVVYTDVATVDEFNTAIAAGQNVRLTKSLTFETKFTVEKDVIIDLNSRKIAVKVGGNTFSKDANVVITNGKIEITDCVASGDAIFCIGNYSNNATLTLDNVAIEGTDYSSAYAVFYVYNTSAFSLNACEVELINDVASAGGFIKAEQGKDGIVNITDSSIALEDAKIGILDGTVTIKGSTLTIKGGANAINQSALTVIDSTMTVDGADGRALTLSQGDVVVENSTLNFSNCSEGEIRFKKSFDLSLDENSTLVQCDVYADASATEANVNGKVVTGTETAPSQVSVYSGEAEVVNHFNGETINDLYQLKEFRDSVNAGNTYAGKTIKLTTDLDLAGIDWEPIGTSANPFKGSFDGDNHTIKNLYINGSMDYDNGTGKNYVGLFGYINNGGSLSNITIENADVSGCLYVGSLVGRVYIGDAITNCHVKGNITVDGYWYVAALAGRYEYAEGIFNCSVDGNNAASSYVKCDTTLNSDHDGSYVGGIVGFTTEPNPVVTISNNSVKNISISGLTRVGGISGIAHQGNIFTGNTVENVNLEAGEGVTTVGLIAGACQGTASSPVTFEGNTVTNSTATVGDVVINDAYGTNINGTSAITNYVARIGSSYYTTLKDAFTAAVDGDTVELVKDVVLTENIYSADKSLTLDGKGFSITQADTFTTLNNNFAPIMLYGNASVDTVVNYTVKNVVFDGWNTNSILRIQDCDAVVDNITVKNTAWDSNVQATSMGILYLQNTNISITNSNFIDNVSSFIVSYNYNGDFLTTSLKIDNCLFEGNTTNGAAGTVYYVEGAGCTITNSEFIGNTVNATGNAATLYLGFQDNCTVTGCLFKDNAVDTIHATTKRVAGGIMIGYEANITGNAFENNSATRNGADVGFADGVCASTYYTAIDLSGNYFNGEYAENGNGYFMEYGYNPVVVENCYTSYEFDANGDLVLEDEILPTVTVRGMYFTDLQAAIDAARAGDTVQLLADIALDAGVTVAKDDAIILDLNGKTVSLSVAATTTSALITNNGTLTVKDSAEGGKLTYVSSTYSTGYSTSTIINNGTLTVESGTIENTTAGGAPYAIDNYNTLTVNGGTIVGNRVTIRQANFGNYDNTVTINGGTIGVAGTSYAGLQLHVFSNAKKTVTEINGGTFNGTYVFYTSFYKVEDSANTDITVNDGTFNGEYAVFLYNSKQGAADYAFDAEINGGTFNGEVYVYVTDSEGANIDLPVISGGTFSTDVSVNTAKGFKCVENADGTYGVLVRDSAFAINGAYISEIVNGVATIVWDVTIGGDYEMAALKVDGKQIYAVDGVYTSTINFNEVANKDSYEVTLTAYATVNGALEKATVTIDSSDITFGVKAFDANGDSYIDIRDVVRLKKASAGMYDFDYDVNGDGVANDAADLALLRRAILTWSAAETIHATPWDGVTTFPAVDLGNKILAVYYPEQLAWISEQVAAGNNLDAYDKIVIARDIDLNNKAWTPIGGATRLSAIFDGQGNTISNLNVQGTKYVGLIGITEDDVMNVNIKNATVIGTHYVAAVVGYMYYDDVINCSVTNATIKCIDKTGKDGDKAGAIVGYIAESGVTMYQLTGCSATDVNITANRDAGYIVGMLQKGVYFTGNTASNCTVTHSDYGTGANLAPAVNYNGMVGRTNEALVFDENKVAVITKPSEMVLFANYVNAGNETSGYTFKLGADIDLKNAEWTPIGNSTYPFKGTFDGQGHTISNLTITTPTKSNVGLFGMTTNGEIKNFTLENATTAGYLNVAAVAGTPYTSTYSNITITGDVKVEGFAYVGALGGKNGYGNVTDITIDVTEDSYVKANSVQGTTAYRTYVGGLIGFMGEGSHTVKNVTSNIDVYGSTCDIGGIVGIAHYNNKFENVVATGDVYMDDVNENEVGGIAGVWHNQSGTTVTMLDCGFTGTIYVGGVEFDCANGGLVNAPYSSTGTGKLIIGVTTAAGLDYALAAGGNINIMEDVTTDSFVVAEDATTNVALNGNTVSGATITNNGTLNISGGTIENDTRSLTNYGTATFTDVTINAGDSGNYSDITTVSGDTTYTNVVLNSKGGGIGVVDGANVTFNSGSVYVDTASTSGRYLFYLEGEGSTLTINGGTFSWDPKDNQKRAYIYAGAGTTVYVTGGNFGKASTRSGYTAGILGDGTVIITGGTFKFDPTTWVADGYKAVLEDGVYTVLPENADCIVYDSAALDTAIADGETAIALGSGTYIIPDSAQGQTLTIVGTGDTVIATQDDGSYEGCDYSLDGSTVTFENITINTDSTTYTGYARLNATYNNCTINGTYTLYGDSIFNDCTFNVSGDVYNIWTWGAPNATFNNCEFNSDGKALLLYGTANTNLTVNNCVFNDNGGLTDKKAAIEVGNDYGKTYTLKVYNTVVNGYEINDKGINTGTTLYGNKNSMSADELIVYIDGERQGLETVTTDDAATLAEALNNGENVVLTTDINAGGQVFVTKGSTFDGGNNTITVDSGSASYESGLTVAEGCVKNVTVTGAFRGLGTGGSGASEMTGDVTYKNVTVEGATYGVNIGVGNGHKLTMIGCSIPDWNSYSGLGSADFIDCTFRSDGTYYASQRISANATFTYTNCNFEQNTFNNVNGSDNYYLDSYGNGTIVFQNCYIDGVLITEDNLNDYFQITEKVTVIVANS